MKTIEETSAATAAPAGATAPIPVSAEKLEALVASSKSPAASSASLSGKAKPVVKPALRAAPKPKPTPSVSKEGISEPQLVLPEPEPVQEIKQLPELLDIEESNVHVDGTCFVVKLYAPACLICTHLIAGGDEDEDFVAERREYSKCHINNGNRFCPAGTFRIEFTGVRVKWQRQIDKVLSLEKGTPERTNATFALLEKIRLVEDQDLQSELLQKIGIA